MTDADAIHAAFVRGDLPALRAALGAGFPAGEGDAGGAFGHPLEYAIYHSPLAFVRTLLAHGAAPDDDDHAGFPPLIAALTTTRDDRDALIELLLAAGADIQRRGINGWTPLHWAAANDDVPGVRLLLAHGADPAARTGIDDDNTPLQEAEALGRAAAAEALRGAAGNSPGRPPAR